MAPVQRLLSLAAVALAVWWLSFMAVDGQATGTMSITNLLPYRVRVLCSSNVEKLPYRDVNAGSAFIFHFNLQKQASWTCTFQSDERDGTFPMWQNPNLSGLCNSVCIWTVAPDGLSLVRTDGKPTLVYYWH